MNKREVKKIINNEVKQLQHNMFMDGWKIVYKTKNLKNDKAQVTVYEDYQEAIIDIDSKSIKNKKDLLDTLRHEFLHCLIFNHTKLFVWFEGNLKKETYELIEVILKSVAEQNVTRLEQMLDIGLKMTPERMIKR